MSSTGVTLMSSGSGTSGEGEKKYLPPQQPLSTLGGHLFTPYHHHPYYPYAPHLGPRLGGPPPPVPSLVPIKKEPGSPLRPDERMKEAAEESHPVIRPHPQSISSSSTSSTLPSLVPDQKLPPSHIPVPPPLTSIDSAAASGLDHGGLVGPDSLRDNSREAILREARETPLLGSSSGVGGASGVGGSDPPQRTLLPPPLTSLTSSAPATSSSSYASGLSGSISHHLSGNTPALHGEKSSHLEQHGGMDNVRQEGGMDESFKFIIFFRCKTVLTIA